MQINNARRSIDEYIELYYRKRPHSSLADQLRDAACDPIGSMTAPDVSLRNLRELSE